MDRSYWGFSFCGVFLCLHPFMKKQNRFKRWFSRYFHSGRSLISVNPFLLHMDQKNNNSSSKRVKYKMNRILYSSNSWFFFPKDFLTQQWACSCTFVCLRRQLSVSLMKKDIPKVLILIDDDFLISIFLSWTISSEHSLLLTWQELVLRPKSESESWRQQD